MDDPVLLSRIQFALTIMFHYLFPPLTIGMAVVLVYLEGMYLRSGEKIYETAARFWTKIFALNFAIGVATGIVMEFQFGTNWANYSRFVGDVFGSALAAEGIFAFFLESGFLAVLVFGWDRVSPRMHFFSTIMVALGSIFSSVWIVVANSWQQTPTGHQMAQVMRNGEPWYVDGLAVMRAEIVDFWQVVFNPSTMHRLVHVWIGAFILGSFFIMSISAYYILKRRHREFARRSFSGALIFATVSSLAALVSGHFQAKNVYHHQPAKMAAFEGHFQSGVGDLSLIGWPDAETKTVRGNIALSGGLSFLLHEDFDGHVEGLDRFAESDYPPLGITFASYHVMILLGALFIVLSLVACWFRWRGTLFEKRWLMRVFVFAVIGPFAANQLGWVAAEVGRQPWVVQPPVQWTDAGRLVTGPDGLVQYDRMTIPREGGGEVVVPAGQRTVDAVSPAVSAGQVLGSIIGFGLIYLLLFAIWLYVLDHKIKQGPAPVEDPPQRTTGEDLMDAASERAG